MKTYNTTKNFKGFTCPIITFITLVVYPKNLTGAYFDVTVGKID